MKSLFNIFYLAFCLVQLVSSIPTTVAGRGRIRRFEATLTWRDWTVAGSVRKTILTNGQFPAPTIRVQQGDWVELMINNWLPFDTSIHFHGIEQLNTPWSDGVPGLSQRPIRPGQSFLYRWKADQYGSYFYHGHTRGQIDDGLYGAIYIEPAASVERPFDGIAADGDDLQKILQAERNTQPVIIGDWTRLTSAQVYQAQVDSGMDAFCVNAMLINGKGSVQCLGQDRINELTTPTMKGLLGNETLTDTACMPPLPALEGNFPTNPDAAPPGLYKGCRPSQGPTEVFRVNPAAGYVSWDLIGATGVMLPVFSVDEHPMWVYAADGRYIEPMQVDAITVPNGVRFSVLVKLDKPSGVYSVRAVDSGVTQIMNATAIMTYTTPHQVPGPSQPYIDITAQNATPTTRFFDNAQVVPFPVELPSMTVDETYKIKVDRYNASYRWILGNESFPMTLNNRVPALFDPNAIPQGIKISTQNGTWVDLIFTVTVPLQPPHPIHKHSNKYFVIGQGMGTFDYDTVEEAMQEIPENFNFVNPQIRDTFLTPPAIEGPTWMAVRYHVVNPGAFIVHCHIQHHFEGGMGLAILDGINAWPFVPREYTQRGLD